VAEKFILTGLLVSALSLSTACRMRSRFSPTQPSEPKPPPAQTEAASSTVIVDLIATSGYSSAALDTTNRPECICKGHRPFKDVLSPVASGIADSLAHPGGNILQLGMDTCAGHGHVSKAQRARAGSASASDNSAN
jgi:hypothetical protein